MDDQLDYICALEKKCEKIQTELKSETLRRLRVNLERKLELLQYELKEAKENLDYLTNGTRRRSTNPLVCKELTFLVAFLVSMLFVGTMFETFGVLGLIAGVLVIASITVYLVHGYYYRRDSFAGAIVYAFVPQ